MSRSVSFTVSPENYSATIGSVTNMITRGLQTGPVLVTMGRPKRNTDQNAKMWALLSDLSQQVEHYGRRYKPEDWKDILTAGFEGAMRFAPTMRGDGIVALGARTSEYSKERMSEFLEFVQAFGAEREVKWSGEGAA